jgi:restriction endonuclease Mrr
MAIPTYDQFIEPLLRFLGSKPQGVSTSEVYVALADSVGLTDDERAQLLPSRRQPVYQSPSSSPEWSSEIGRRIERIERGEAKFLDIEVHLAELRRKHTD